VTRPFFYIQPFVPIFTAPGMVRKRKNIPLGFCDEMAMGEAKRAKKQIMATVNAPECIAQSQVPFSEILRRFRDVRLPQLGSATRAKYAAPCEPYRASVTEPYRCEISIDPPSKPG
jgi:hypothetical protein